MVEIVDADALGRLERRDRRIPTRLRGEPRPRRPEERGIGDGGTRQLFGRERHVRRRGLAVKEQREAIGRVDLAEHQRRAQRGMSADEGRVDAETVQRLAHVIPEAVASDLCDDRGPPPEA